jgi:uncharacterized damage-inducible protein DinB
MTTADRLRELYRHMEWADAKAWTAVVASESALADESIRTKLHHVHMVQHAFAGAWTSRAHVVGAGADLAISDLVPWGRETHADLSAFLSNLSDDDLDGAMPVPWATFVAAHFGHDVAVTTLGETLLQVPMHTAYHRGQVAMRLRELGLEPPLTDFIVWAWLGKPRPEWPAGA